MRKVVVCLLLFFIIILYPYEVNASGFRELCRFEAPIAAVWSIVPIDDVHEAMFEFSFQQSATQNRIVVSRKENSRHGYTQTRDINGTGNFNSGALGVTVDLSDRWGIFVTESRVAMLHFRLSNEVAREFFEGSSCQHLEFNISSPANNPFRNQHGYYVQEVEIINGPVDRNRDARTGGNPLFEFYLFGESNRVDGNHEQSCNSLLGDPTEPDDLAWLLSRILAYFRIIAPSLVIVLSSVDFAKAVISSDEEASLKARKKLIVRIILAMSLFLLPEFISLIFGIVGLTHANATCGI